MNYLSTGTSTTDATLANVTLPSLLSWPAAGIQRPAAWNALAFYKIYELEKEGEDLDFIGDLRIEPRAASNARMLINSLAKALSNSVLPSPFVSPITGGSIGLTWRVGSNEVEVVVYPEGVTTFLECAGDEVKNEGEFDQDSSPDRLTQSLERLLKG